LKIERKIEIYLNKLTHFAILETIEIIGEERSKTSERNAIALLHSSYEYITFIIGVSEIGYIERKEEREKTTHIIRDAFMNEVSNYIIVSSSKRNKMDEGICFREKIDYLTFAILENKIPKIKIIIKKSTGKVRATFSENI